jgi:hypothetical protein
MMMNSQTVKALERRKNPPPLQPLNAIQARRDLMWGANCLRIVCLPMESWGKKISQATINHFHESNSNRF